MTRDDIIRLAKNEYGIYAFTAESLAHFAALVAAAERERMDLNAIHSCHAECQNPFCVRVREAVAHEREACAKLCEDGPIPKDSTTLTHIPTLVGCAAAIRARGNTGIKWEVEP
jgi:hypothetical protein